MKKSGIKIFRVVELVIEIQKEIGTDKLGKPSDVFNLRNLVNPRHALPWTINL